MSSSSAASSIIFAHLWNGFCSSVQFVSSTFLSIALLYFSCCSSSGFLHLFRFSIFLVLGVGADDLFVFVDAWKQSDEVVDQNLQPDWRLVHRMKYAYTRTFGAVFNTSFTTAMAFVSTGELFSTYLV